MRPHASSIVVCGLLLLACAGSDPLGKPDPKETGGAGGEDSQGGAGGSSPGGKGGSSTGGKGGSGTGGAAGSGTGGSMSTGGAGGGSGAGGSSGAGAAGGAMTSPDAGSEMSSADAGPPPVMGGAAPFGCTNCKQIFDGKTLDGWETRDTTNWLAKDGALASQGKVAPIWTKADFGDYRIFFKVRQVKGDHKPDVIFFGKRPGPGAGGSGALGGAQFQPPNGGSWDYGAGGNFTRPENPMWDVNKWHSCEVLVKEAGSFRAACCPMEPEAPCKLVLTWKGTGRKHPWAIQMHNPGLFDEYKDIFVEENPTVDELLSLKK